MWYRTTAALAAAILIGGCASLPGDRGRSEVNELAARRDLPVAPDGRSAELASELLSRPLGPAQAVQVALLQNAGLRAEYASLGLPAAEVYEAGRLSNPRLGGSWLESDESGALDQVTFGLSQSLASLLTLGDRSRLAEADFARARAEVAAAVFGTAMETGRAWYRLAAARENAEIADRIADAARAAADLGQRFLDAGNINRLELAELKTHAAEARVEAVEARAAVDEARAALGTLMGVDPAVDWRLRGGLPEPVREIPANRSLKRRAADNRLDLLAARRAVTALERALDVTRRWRWLGDPELELETERETDGSRLTGGGLSIEVPLFNQHADEIERGRARLDVAYARRDAVANRASHELALARARLEAANQHLAALEDELLPARRHRVEETQKQVNFMLMGVFELVETRIAEYRSVADYLAAIRDHWLARLTLQAASGSFAAPPAERERITAGSLVDRDAAPGAMHHMDHGEAAGTSEPGDDRTEHDH